ncbi:XdhC family protein [Aliarcobacter lanthieri]|uniref:XdhC family protein n=1 Tax=Aliarcobacter lanthieri TaxID=1355374 RepID=UPI003AAE8596
MFLDKDILNFIEKSILEKLDIVVTCVINTQGSTYSKAGNILVFNSKNEFCGVLGSPYLHNEIFELSKKSLESREIQTFKSIPKDKSSNHGFSSYKIEPFFYDENYFEISKYIKKPYSLLIFGSASHTTSLIKMANIMGWETTIIDIKIDEKFVKEADNKIELGNLDDIFKLDLNSFDASIILSHNPKTDKSYLKALISSNIKYIGMMGNKKNMQNIKKEFALENSDRFFAPIGFDIGGNSHQAIALSICAQIEAKKNGKLK